MAHRRSAYDVFLSYSRGDNGHVDKIAHFLADAGLAVWYDRWALVPGEQISDTVTDGIKAARAIIVFIGEKALSNSQAFELGAWQSAHPLIGTIVALLPGAKDIPPIVGARTVDFRGPSEEQGLNDLIDALRGIGRGIRPFGPSLSVDAEHHLTSTKSTQLRINIERKLQKGENDLDLARDFRDLANTLREQGRYDDAEAYYRRALEILRALPENRGFLYEGIVLGDFALSLKGSGRFDEAEAHYREAIQILRSERAAPHVSRHLGATLNNFGDVLQATHRFAEAERIYKEAVECARDAFDADDPRLAAALANLGSALSHRADAGDEAEALFRQSLAILEHKPDINRAVIASVLNNLGQLLYERGKYDDAKDVLSQSLQLTIESEGEVHESVAATSINLSVVLGELGRHAEALDASKRALAILEATAGPEHPTTVAALDAVARAYMSVSMYQEAEASARRALEVTRLNRSARDPVLAIRLSTLAAILYSFGDIGEALKYATESVAVSESAFGPNDQQTIVARENLAVMQQALEK
jgi:tetratricopeptide (TPR) repeat protein